jgi:hypothetical protein
MKRIAVISLIALLLITQHTFASCLLEGCFKGVETSQCEKLTQGETEELFKELISTTNWDNLGQIQQNPNLCRLFTTLAFLSLIAYPLSPSDATFIYVVNTWMVYLLLCGSPNYNPQFGSIVPYQGRQEEQLTITITGINTTFQDDGINDIIFSPEGITVDSINIQSNTEVECDITIAANAEPRDYSVTVIWDNGNQFVTGVNVFEVSIPINDIEFTPPDELDPGGSPIDIIVVDPYPDDIFDEPIE